MRAVTPVRRYFLRPPASGWSEALWKKDILPFVRATEKALEQELTRKLIDGIITKEEYGVSFDHELWTIVALRFGMTYSYSED